MPACWIQFWQTKWTLGQFWSVPWPSSLPASAFPVAYSRLTDAIIGKHLTETLPNYLKWYHRQLGYFHLFLVSNSLWPHWSRLSFFFNTSCQPLLGLNLVCSHPLLQPIKDASQSAHTCTAAWLLAVNKFPSCSMHSTGEPYTYA